MKITNYLSPISVIFLAISLTAYGQTPTPTPAKEPPNLTSAYAQFVGDRPPRLNFEFAGGTLEEFALRLSEEKSEGDKLPCNVIVEDSAKELMVPKFKVTGVTARTLLETVAKLSKAELDPVVDSGSEVFILSSPPPPSPLMGGRGFGGTAVRAPLPTAALGFTPPASPPLPGAATAPAGVAPIPTKPRKVVPIFVPMLADGSANKEEEGKRRAGIMEEVSAEVSKQFPEWKTSLSWHERSQILVIETESVEALDFVKAWFKAQEDAAEFQRQLKMHQQGSAPHPQSGLKRPL